MRNTWKIWPMFSKGVREWRLSAFKASKKVFLWSKSASMFPKILRKYLQKNIVHRNFLQWFNLNLFYISFSLIKGYHKFMKSFITRWTTPTMKKTWGCGLTRMGWIWQWIGPNSRYCLCKFYSILYTLDL